MSLESIGYGAFFERALRDHPGCVPARVVRSHAGSAELLTSVDAQVTALAPRNVGLLVVGDWVALDPAAAVVRALLPRRTAFVRQAAGKATNRQVLAANVDVAFIVMGLDQDFNLRRLERYLTLARGSGIRPVVLLTKVSLVTEPGEQITSATAIAGEDVVAIDVVAGVAADAPACYLGPGTTVALLGSSGAGKSTLLNYLCGGAGARTGAVRAGDGRGRHTTTHRQLFVLPGGGTAIDTPGLRELQLWAEGTTREALDETFREVAEHAQGCRFADCLHDAEPGCAVRAALDAGEIDPARVDAYQQLQRELDGQHTRQRTARDGDRRPEARMGGRLAREANRHKQGRG